MNVVGGSVDPEQAQNVPLQQTQQRQQVAPLTHGAQLNQDQ